MPETTMATRVVCVMLKIALETMLQRLRNITFYCQMWTYIAQLHRAPNALVSLVHREEMSLQSRLKGVRTQQLVVELSW